jgi:hypothetical protein
MAKMTNRKRIDMLRRKGILSDFDYEQLIRTESFRESASGSAVHGETATFSPRWGAFLGYVVFAMVGLGLILLGPLVLYPELARYEAGEGSIRLPLWLFAVYKLFGKGVVAGVATLSGIMMSVLSGYLAYVEGLLGRETGL